MRRRVGIRSACCYLASNRHKRFATVSDIKISRGSEPGEGLPSRSLSSHVYHLSKPPIAEQLLICFQFFCVFLNRYVSEIYVYMYSTLQYVSLTFFSVCNEGLGFGYIHFVLFWSEILLAEKKCMQSRKFSVLLNLLKFATGSRLQLRISISIFDLCRSQEWLEWMHLFLFLMKYISSCIKRKKKVQLYLLILNSYQKCVKTDEN